MCKCIVYSFIVRKSHFGKFGDFRIKFKTLKRTIVVENDGIGEKKTDKEKKELINELNYNVVLIFSIKNFALI